MAKHLGSLIIENDLTVRDVLKLAAFTVPGEVLTITDVEGTVGVTALQTLDRRKIALADWSTGTLAGDWNAQDPFITVDSNDLIVVTWALTGEDYLYMGTDGTFGLGGADTATISDFYLLGTSGTPGGNEFLDDVFRILNAADTTKQLAFNTANIAPNTTRTIIMPNYDVDLGALPQPPLTGAVDPNAAILPRYIGDLYINVASDPKTSWIANSLLNTSWERIDNVQSTQAAADPAITNDSTEGFEFASLWLNSNTNETFICKDAAVGAAIWVSASGGSGASIIYNVNQVGHGLLVDQTISLPDGSTSYVLASAADSTLKADGIVTEVVDVDNFKFQNSGEADYNLQVLVPGRDYYLAIAPGEVIDTEPSDFKQSIFKATDTNRILISIGDMFVFENLDTEYMKKAVYDVNDSGVVDDSEKLGGNLPATYATQIDLATKEDGLGNPLVDGYVLSSTIAGIRSWIVQSGGGGGDANLTQDVNTTITVGAIPAGTLLPTGLSYTDFVIQLTSPTLPPTITTAKSVVIGGFSPTTVEVGTLFITVLTATYNTGIITDGGGGGTVPLAGAGTTETFNGPGANPTTGAVSMNITQGNSTNRWSVDQDYLQETAPYFDSAGNPSTIYDAQRGPGTLISSDIIMTGQYKYWWYVGPVGSVPNNSAQVRLLPNDGFDTVSSFNINIPLNTKGVAFYLPVSFTSVTVNYVESSNADVTGTFVSSPITVDDAGGNPISYNKWEATIGGTGYPSNATYKVTI